MDKEVQIMSLIGNYPYLLGLNEAFYSEDHIFIVSGTLPLDSLIFPSFSSLFFIYRHQIQEQEDLGFPEYNCSQGIVLPPDLYWFILIMEIGDCMKRVL